MIHWENVYKFDKVVHYLPWLFIISMFVDNQSIGEFFLKPLLAFFLWLASRTVTLGWLTDGYTLDKRRAAFTLVFYMLVAGLIAGSDGILLVIAYALLVPIAVVCLILIILVKRIPFMHGTFPLGCFYTFWLLLFAQWPIFGFANAFGGRGAAHALELWWILLAGGIFYCRWMKASEAGRKEELRQELQDMQAQEQMAAASYLSTDTHQPPRSKKGQGYVIKL